MPNFNDVYLHNYEVLDNGLICKKYPKWGLVSVVGGPVPKKVGYMAWKWIRISLDSRMVVLMDLVQYCMVSHIPGAQGGS
jgi:hypothetical protein